MRKILCRKIEGKVLLLKTLPLQILSRNELRENLLVRIWLQLKTLLHVLPRKILYGKTLLGKTMRKILILLCKGLLERMHSKILCLMKIRLVDKIRSKGSNRSVWRTSRQQRLSPLNQTRIELALLTAEI